MRTISIGTAFSGIGAPEQALRRLGVDHSIIFAGDIDSFCKQTYFANYDITEDRWHEDVRSFDACPYEEKVDLFIGGSPCQSFSVMGKQGGLEETRGTLFYEYARIVKETRPKVFIYENVTGMLSHDKGRTWNTISGIFNDLGYRWTLWVLNAKDFGLPHNRKRIFVVGFKEEYQQQYFSQLKAPVPIPLEFELKDFLDKEVPNKYYLPVKGFERVIDPAQTKHVALNGRIARCQVACQQYNWFGDMRFESVFPKRIADDARIHKGYYKGVLGVARTLTPRECLRLMGFPDDFNIVVNDTQMYRQSGNSIAVNVIMAVIQSVIATKIYD